MRTGRACPQPCAAEGSGVGLQFRLLGRLQAGPSLCRGLSLPICKTAPRKPSLEDPGEEVRDGTYRRISCLVRNVKSWKADQDAVSGQPGGRARPPAATPLPSSGRRASSPGPRVPRTWYSASSSLDRRLPEPPIAEPRAQLRQLVSGRRQLSHFRPRAASPPRPRGNRPWGPRPRARLLLKAPRRSQPGSAVCSQLWAVPGNLEAGPRAGSDAPGRGPGCTAPPPGMGGAGHASCVRAGYACVESTTPSQWPR